MQTQLILETSVSYLVSLLKHTSLYFAPACDQFKSLSEITAFRVHVQIEILLSPGNDFERRAVQIFGAMLPCELRLSDTFYGSGELFLFTFFPTFKVQSHHYRRCSGLPPSSPALFTGVA